MSKRKILNIIFSVVVVLALPFSSIPQLSQTAHAAPDTTTTTPPATTPPATVTPTTGQNCAVEKIGWFVCPLMEQAAKISDKAFQILADNFLKTDPELFSNQSGTKDAWEISRNIADLMFIAAFLIIIVSQVTGVGLTNYGLKKMIPRLLVAALLVNVSYYICQLLVDLTNIFGYEIEELLTQLANTLGPSVFGQASQLGAANVGNSFGNYSTYIVEGALAATAVVWLIMGPMLAVIAMVLITAVTIVVILLLRKALIVLLIVISPIAFVMYLLPNTEKLFDKWKDMFIKLLFVFPVIGMLFGGGQLASTIILVSGAESQTQADASKNCNPDDIQAKKAFATAKTTGSYDSCGLGSVIITGTKSGDVGPSCSGGKGAGCHLATSWMLGLVALGVAVAPMIAVWSVLKGALAASSAINGKIQSISKKGDGLTKRMQVLDENRQKTLNARGLQGHKFTGNPMAGISRNRKRRGERRDARLAASEEMFDAGNEKAKKISEDMKTSQLLGQAAKQRESEEFLQQVAGGISTDGQGKYAGDLAKQLEGQQTKAKAEAVKEAELHIDNGNLVQLGTQLEKAVADGDQVLARALQNTLLKSGSAGLKQFKSTVSNIERTPGSDTSDLMANIRANHGGIKGEDKGIDGWAKQLVDGGSLESYSGTTNNANKTWDSTTAAEFASLSKQAQEVAVHHLSDDAKADLTNAANGLLAKVGPEARKHL